MIPRRIVGLEDRRRGAGTTGSARFSTNDELPGDPDARRPTSDDHGRLRARARCGCVADFLESLPPRRRALEPRPAQPVAQRAARPRTRIAPACRRRARAACSRPRGALHDASTARADAALASDSIDDAPRGHPRHARASSRRRTPTLRRTWHLVRLMTASVRGVLADDIVSRPRGFRAVNDEDFLDWIIRHGAAPEVADLAFSAASTTSCSGTRTATRGDRGVSAGLARVLTAKMFFDYKGAIFWKMTAGMGDVVFAPMYEALRSRGVQFEFFHRVDALHVSGDGTDDRSDHDGASGRAAPVANATTRSCASATCRASRPRRCVEQLADADGIDRQPLEVALVRLARRRAPASARAATTSTSWCSPSLSGMAPYVCRELIERPARVAGDGRTPRHRRDPGVPALAAPGRARARLGRTRVRRSARTRSRSTPGRRWPSCVDAEAGPTRIDRGRSRTSAARSDAPDDSSGRPPTRPPRAPPAPSGRRNAVEFRHRRAPAPAPRRSPADGFRWDLLCGAGGERRAARSTRSTCAPTSTRPTATCCRCRAPTASGCAPTRAATTTSFLAGDWTDNGLNAGCIEAAVLGAPGRERGARPLPQLPHRRELPRLTLSR